MKDFIFSDPSESTAIVKFRTDLIGSNDNFTILQIEGLDNVQTYQQKKVRLLTEFKKLPSSKRAFIQFAETYGLNLVMQDSNGENATTLVDYDSDAASDSW